MRLLLDSNFYSVLYYNSVLWLTPELSSVIKHLLLSTSANALRTCMLFNNVLISFEAIHKSCKKCTPNQIMFFQISLQVHKTVNDISQLCTTEHALLLNNVVCTSRQLMFGTLRSNRTKIGMNTLLNKFYQVSKMP